MKTFVLYHAHCADGFGAAYAAWLALGDKDVEYIPTSYGEKPPEMPDGSRVYILDFSYDRETLLALKARMSSLNVIDHHGTAAVALEGLPFAIFDMDKSGAVLAWEFFQGTGECLGAVPKLLEYIQDRDLWRWELPQSRDISAGLSIYPKEFSVWKKLDTAGLDALKGDGAVTRLVHGQQLNSIVSRAHWARIDGQLVMVCNATVLISEAAEKLLQKYPESPFVACYFDAPKGKAVVRNYSLRSRPNFDVSAVAARYGGGGHKQAAGFSMEIKALAI